MNSIKEYVAKQKQLLKEEIENNNLKPVLAIVQVGDDPASNSYVKGKLKDCEELGITSKHIKKDSSISQEELDDLLIALGHHPRIDGVIVQLPLPRNLKVWYMDERKDVDGFRANSWYNPCTPLGIKLYLQDRGVDFDGKNVVVIGRSEIVGKPMAKLMLEANATVTVCHSHTKDVSMYTKMADIIIVAVGKRNFLTRDMIGDNRPIVIDVGINRNEEGKLCGDCDYANLVDVCEYVSPVPNGVGLLTRLALMMNVVEATKMRGK